MLPRKSKLPDSPPPPELALEPLEATRQLLDVSVTERITFRSCRRRWYLTTLENLQPKNQSEIALEFGTAMHSVLEAYYSGASREEAALELEKWFEYMDDIVTEQDAWEEVLEHIDLGRQMLELYWRFDEVSPVQLGRPLAVEGIVVGEGLNPQRPEGYPPEADVRRHESGRLMVPIVDPDTKQPIGNETAYLTARLDLITERLTPKLGHWVTDHKNLSRAPSDKGLDFDDQVTGYCYVKWRWTGVVPRGVIYNTLIKNSPKPPRFVQDKKKISDRLVLSTAKDQLCTPDAYREALIDEGLMVGGRVISEPHEKCLAALLARGWDPFFRRQEITRNMEQLLSFERRLAAEYSDMLDAAFDSTGDSIYPNQSMLVCPTCPVRSICLAMEDGSDVADIVEHNFVVGPDRKAR